MPGVCFPALSWTGNQQLKVGVAYIKKLATFRGNKTDRD